MAQSDSHGIIQIKYCSQRLKFMRKSSVKMPVVFKKTLATFVLPLIIMAVLFSCTKNYYPTKHTPPGQAKKASGSKSAKAYAPGQQKKH